MKYLLVLTALFLCELSFSQKVDTVAVQFQGTQFVHIKNDSNTKAMIFLHGGVNNPIFDDATGIVDIDFLLEGNKEFVLSSLNSGFDLIIPVTNTKMNWLSNHGYSYDIIKAHLKTLKSYSANYVAGFSDGGSGGYKLFYENSDDFDGLIVFNGYPQHQNFNRSVKYAAVTDKRIIFSSTFKDQVIPYEFLLTEYSQQKKTNPNTYLFVNEGGHSFGDYGKEVFDSFFDILNENTSCALTEPIHGFIREDELEEFYRFRKKICRKFGYGKEVYLENKSQSVDYKSKVVQ